MWSCDCCGLCCRHVGRFALMRDYALPDGSCKHLVDNKCEIYDHRPVICNVSEMYKLFFKERMSETEYYAIQEQACALLKNEVISVATTELEQ